MPRRRPRGLARLAACIVAVPVGKPHAVVDIARELAGIVRHAEQPLVGHELRRHEVAPAELVRADAELARRLVDQALDQIGGLGSAGAAIGVGPDRVGEDPLHFGEDRRRRVRPAQHLGIEDRRAERSVVRAVGAEIRDCAHPQAPKSPDRIESELGMADVIATLGITQEGLRPPAVPLDGPAESLGRPQHQRVLRIGVVFHAEAAAHLRRNHSQSRLVDTEARGDDAAHVINVLAVDIEGVALLGGVVDAGRAARLNCAGHRTIVNKVKGNNPLGGGERGLCRRPVAFLPVEADVVRRLVPQLGGIGICGLRRLRDRRERRIGNIDPLRSGERLGLRLGDNHRHRVSDMSCPRRRDNRMRRAEGVGAIAPLERARAREGNAGERREPGGRDVGPGIDREDTRCGLRPGRVERPDLGMGVRRSNDGGVGLAVQVDVVLEPRAPCEKAIVLLAPDGLPNPELSHLVRLPAYPPIGLPLAMVGTRQRDWRRCSLGARGRCKARPMNGDRWEHIERITCRRR